MKRKGLEMKCRPLAMQGFSIYTRSMDDTTFTAMHCFRFLFECQINKSQRIASPMFRYFVQDL